MINYLKGLYETLPNGEVKAMDCQRLSPSNKVLNYLGMDFDFSVEGEVSISMKHYVNKIIKGFPGKIKQRNGNIPANAMLGCVQKGRRSSIVL